MIKIIIIKIIIIKTEFTLIKDDFRYLIIIKSLFKLRSLRIKLLKFFIFF